MNVDKLVLHTWEPESFLSELVPRHEAWASLRSITDDAHDGLWTGYLAKVPEMDVYVGLCDVGDTPQLVRQFAAADWIDPTCNQLFVLLDLEPVFTVFTLTADSELVVWRPEPLPPLAWLSGR